MISENLKVSKINILIVEDNIPTQNLFRRILELSGFRVVDCADNGYEAVEKYKKLIRNSNDKPDVILMDHHMPLKTGIDATKEIKKLNGNVKIIFTSGDTQIKKEAIAIGAVDFIEKPCDIAKMIKSISNALAT